MKIGSPENLDKLAHEGAKSVESAQWFNTRVFGRECTDHLGRIALREFFKHAIRGKLFKAFKTLGVAIWHTRGQLLVLPWKYRRRLLSIVRHSSRGSDAAHEHR